MKPRTVLIVAAFLAVVAVALYAAFRPYVLIWIWQVTK
jgi:hypothetical protein